MDAVTERRHVARMKRKAPRGPVVKKQAFGRQLGPEVVGENGRVRRFHATKGWRSERLVEGV